MASESFVQPGLVYLVGAGPGDPRLITERGAACLRHSDVVVYDSLASPGLLELAPAAAERIPVGKRHGCRPMAQEAINELLIARARAGKVVVRLKGGDPFVFGRGGEEAYALRAARVPFEVVPGVTAGVAAPACAGIPVTFRDRASAVAFVTAHEASCKPTNPQIDWHALAQFPGTLVFYMGLSRLEPLAQSLIANGLSPDTPAAVIEWGTTPGQRTVIGTVRDLALRSQTAHLKAPAVIVVGQVVTLADQLRWFEDRPLFGQRVLVTRPAHQAGPMVERLRSLGADVLELPALQIQPPESWAEVDQAIARLDHYAWVVFSSANGVRCFLSHLLDSGKDVRILGKVRIAAIGSATAHELERYHLRADLVPDEARSESLVDALRNDPAGGPLLLLRADRSREALGDGLRAAGMSLDEVVVYRNVESSDWDAMVLDQIERGAIDWITVTSPGIVRSLNTHLSDRAKAQIGPRIKLASISPLTSAAARELGWQVAAEAASATNDAVIDAMVQGVANQSQTASQNQPAIRHEVP